MVPRSGSASKIRFAPLYPSVPQTSHVCLVRMQVHPPYKGHGGPPTPRFLPTQIEPKCPIIGRATWYFFTPPLLTLLTLQHYGTCRFHFQSTNKHYHMGTTSWEGGGEILLLPHLLKKGSSLQTPNLYLHSCFRLEASYFAVAKSTLLRW